MLYDFHLHIGKSCIPNSGFGVFLTFKGAHLLKSDALERAQQLMEGRHAVEVPTTCPIDAENADGTGFSVSLQGENLHGNGNNPYFAITRFPLKAILSNGKKILVKIGPKNIHEDVDKLRRKKEIASPKDGLGHFNMHTEEDYMKNNDIQFCSHADGCGLIDIGRYGPFLPSGTSSSLVYSSIKMFLISHYVRVAMK